MDCRCKKMLWSRLEHLVPILSGSYFFKLFFNSDITIIVALFFFPYKANPFPFYVSCIKTCAGILLHQSFSSMKVLLISKLEEKQVPLLGKKTPIFPWKQIIIFTKSEPPQCAHPERQTRVSRRLQFPKGLSPASAQGSCPARAALVGNGRINVRKLSIRIKPQTITGSGIR